MRGLEGFVGDIKRCQSKEQEEQRVKTELAKIRQKFANPEQLSGYDKKKYLWKLLYSHMLGYEVDFGHAQAIDLCSSNKFSEKNAGYLAISLWLADNPETLRLVENIINVDMRSGNEHIAALALNTVANIGGAAFADIFFTNISKMLLSSIEVSAFIKRKACICLLRLYRGDKDDLQLEIWPKTIGALYHEKDIGLLTSVSGLVLGILAQGAVPIGEWAEIVPSVGQCLHALVQGDCPEHYEYYRVPAPWLQTKLLRILQFFPAPILDMETLQRVNATLHSILTKPRVAPALGGGKKRTKAEAEQQNRSNAEHAVFFEAMNLMIELGDRGDADALRTAADMVGAYINSADLNIRWLGLKTMARLATLQPLHGHLEKHKDLIYLQMHGPDIPMQREALNVLVAFCRPETYQQVAEELLELFGHSDARLQEELELKLAILAERHAPNLEWC